MTDVLYPVRAGVRRSYRPMTKRFSRNLIVPGLKFFDTSSPRKLSSAALK